MVELTNEQKRHLEGYAAALQDIQKAFTGMNWCNKHYDPMTILEDEILSYAYNLKNGGRVHPLSEFESVGEIQQLMLDEVSKEIKEEIKEGLAKCLTTYLTHSPDL